MQNNDEPLVTVIIPTIGRPVYIVDTLRSVLLQTYNNLQILISDNAPTVKTASLLAAEGVTDPRIEIVVRSTRLGFSAHMNACLAQARGSHVMILSDDDQITSGYVSDMVMAMVRHPDVKVCFGRQIQINQSDVGLISISPNHQPTQFIEGVVFINSTLSGRFKSGILTYISMFARRDDIISAGGFKDYPDGSHADNFILFNLALSGGVAIAASIMYYRVYVESTGLRTPFSSLFLATSAFTRDCAEVVQNSNTVNTAEKYLIMKNLHRSNTLLLLSRIRRVYADRLTLLALFGCLLKVIKYRLSSF